MDKLQITPDQARRAFCIIYSMIDEAFPKGGRVGATQINVHPTTVISREELEGLRNSVFDPDTDKFRRGFNLAIEELLARIK